MTIEGWKIKSKIENYKFKIENNKIKGMKKEVNKYEKMRK